MDVGGGDAKFVQRILGGLHKPFTTAYVVMALGRLGNIFFNEFRADVAALVVRAGRRINAAEYRYIAVSEPALQLTRERCGFRPLVRVEQPCDGVTGDGVGVGSVYIHAVVRGSAAVIMNLVTRDSVVRGGGGEGDAVGGVPLGGVTSDGVVGGGEEVDAGAAVALGGVARDGVVVGGGYE